jgi:hypothetical protein
MNEPTADIMSLLSILEHAVREGLASWVPWCAAHNRPIPDGHTQCDHGKYTDDCRLEEPARHIVLGGTDE